MQQRKNRLYISIGPIVLLGLLSLPEFNCTGGKRIVASILCDLSSSVDAKAYEILAKNTSDVLYYFHRNKARGRLFVMHGRSDIQPSIDFDFGNTTVGKFFQVQEKIEKFLNTTRSTNPALESTCILDAIARAVAYFEELEHEECTFELVILSDMVEECRGINLKKIADSPDSIHARIKSLPPKKLNWSNVNVSIILCTSTAIPPIAVRQNFWEAVFQYYGFPKENMKERFYFKVDKPVRFAAGREPRQ